MRALDSHGQQSRFPKSLVAMDNETLDHLLSGLLTTLAAYVDSTGGKAFFPPDRIIIRPAMN
jgi:hypothetical protein